MSEHSINLQPTGSPAFALPPEPDDVGERLSKATNRAAIAAVVADAPRSLFAWAALGEAETDPVQRYAAFRVGYHRGLDALRANGWRGAGQVPWSSASNRGFLRCLRGLAQAAGQIGELDEVERITSFLALLDPQR